MNRLIAFLGVISCLIAVAVGAKVTVNHGTINVKPGANVTLECTGSETSLSYYIKNRINWAFKGVTGQITNLTEGFYPVDDAKATFEDPINHYRLNYSVNAGGYTFALSVKGVTDADNGEYVCSLINEAKQLESQQAVKVNVIRPVQKVKLELHDANHNVVASSMGPVSQGDMAKKIVPGSYMAKCVADGSNPEPQMTLMFEEDVMTTGAETSHKVKDNRLQYSGNFMISLDLQASSIDQELVCDANIAGNAYPTMVAGLLFRIEIDKPTVSCSNLTRALGDRYQTVVCNLTAPGGLTCDKVAWIFADENYVIIPDDQKFKDPSGHYDIMSASCMGTESFLSTNLTFYELKESHFKSVYYVQYGGGDGAHRTPVIVYEDTSAGASAIVPLFSSLSAILLTVFAKHLL